MTEIWIGKQVLPIVDAVDKAISNGKDWYTSLPHIKFVMESPAMVAVKDVVTSAINLQLTTANVGKVFCETVYGINLARNSRVYQQNLAGRGLSLLGNIKPSSRDKSLYESAVIAHNESLNLPRLSVELAAIEDQIAAIEKPENPLAIMEEWRQQAMTKTAGIIDILVQKIEELKGNARRGANVQLDRATKATMAMRTGQIPLIFANSDYEVRSTLNWDIGSISKYGISSISQQNIYANAIVPIAVGGAATIAGAGAIIGSIASWLLSSFFLKGLAGFPMQMLDALKHTVTSIVLKVLGSSGANAYRFLAASVIKAGKSLIPVVFAHTGMFSAAWTFLMPYAAPIIGAAVLILLAMRNKPLVGQNLYVYGKTSDTMFSLGTAHLYDTNRAEMRSEMQRIARELKAESIYDFSQLYGVATDDDDKPVMVLNLLDTENPILTVGEEAIAELLGNWATMLQTFTLF
ncbi:hypothetical protein QUB68_25065 [Microcoleus sp. A006_D1]|uniref:hypothetical protein n=1 Tax=Microcoleus sp. A006_D1 TaxID=3055267 RepID=UPI002FD647D5